MDKSVENPVQALREEAERMLASVRSAQPGAAVRMSVDQFEALARLLKLVCDLVPEPENDGFGDARYWVPLEVYARTRRAAALENLRF